MNVIKNRPPTKPGMSTEMVVADAINKLERIQKLEENPNYIEKYCGCGNKHFVLDESEEPDCICKKELPKGMAFYLCQSGHRTIMESYFYEKNWKCSRCQTIQETETKSELEANKKFREKAKEEGTWYKKREDGLLEVVGEKIEGFTNPEVFYKEIEAKRNAKALVDELESRGLVKKI